MQSHSTEMRSKAHRLPLAAGLVFVSLVAASPVSRADDKGKTTYDATCALCHGTGIAGAPKFGDKSAWAPRIATGMPTLYDHALKGFQGKAGMMPPKGGNGSLSDDDARAAVDYMINAAK